MKTVLVLADQGGAIERLHKNVAVHISAHFTLKFYESSNFDEQKFAKEFHLADLCLTTGRWLDTLTNSCKLSAPEFQKKIVAVCHDRADIPQTWSPDITYGATADDLLQLMPAGSQLAFAGVAPLRISRKQPSGKIETLGWFGKESDLALSVSQASGIPLSVSDAESFPQVQEWYRSIDVLLFAEGPEVRAFEAIACGVMVIGTNQVPGPKFSTIEEAAQILRELAGSPERTKDLAMAQYKWLVSNRAINVLSKSWTSMLEAAVAKRPFLDFIEVGTSDFDTEIEKKDNKVGVSIEPIKYYLDRLPNKHRCKKLNIAISDYTGTCDVNFLSVDTITRLGFPDWVKGSNCINGYHKLVAALCAEKSIDIASVATTEVVPVRPLMDVMQSLNFDGLYYLKIDAEGHDVVILKKFAQDLNGNKNMLPHLIQFESNMLTSSEAVQEIVTLFGSLGYDLVSRGGDTVMRRNLQVKDKKQFTATIPHAYIMDYPANYNVLELPHENTLEAAKEYCVQNDCSGVTLEGGTYQVRAGRYLSPTHLNVCSWIFV